MRSGTDKKPKKSECYNCGKITNKPISISPPRHMQSPTRFTDESNKTVYNYFCSLECSNKTTSDLYEVFASLDSNCSDCNNFQGVGWVDSTDSPRKWRVKTKLRVGKCLKNNIEIEVEPMSPGNNSGQPRWDCFELRIK